MYFFFNDTATTEIYTLSLHDALPIWGEIREVRGTRGVRSRKRNRQGEDEPSEGVGDASHRGEYVGPRSEEHTSELQSRQYLVCRLLLEKKNSRAYSSSY